MKIVDIVSRLDPKELDVLLAEVTLLNTRAELYLRFVKRRVLVSFFAGDDQTLHSILFDTKTLGSNLGTSNTPPLLLLFELL